MADFYGGSHPEDLPHTAASYVRPHAIRKYAVFMMPSTAPSARKTA